jgi:penicillin-binding protein 1A
MDLDGAVRAMVGGRDYSVSQFNRATDALRQPGSSFKPYVYAAALANGMKPTTIVRDEPFCLGNWCPQNYSRSYSGPVTLTHALVKSINIIPVRLSVMLGGGNAKAGRAKIIDLARRMGLRTPLPDSSSLPIGAAEVTVLDHTAAYATFPNLGKAVTPHAVLEIRTATGDLVWRFDRDGKKPVQVLSPQVAMDMNMIMNKVVEEGTGRRAILEGVRAAGKTGTTNAYRDAWFVGYTGNYVCGVWFGNDDYAPTKRMTGGSLPAMTWREIMAYAHQGIELKPIPGVPPGPPPPPPDTVAVGASPREAPTRPIALNVRAAEILVRIERLFDDATRALTASPGPLPAPRDERRGAGMTSPVRVSAAERDLPVRPRGN